MLNAAPAPPRYATARTPARPSYGAAIAKVAAALGKPLQAWQRQVVDVATEVMPDGSWAYRTVVIHVQRQAGKTTLIGPVNLHRTLTRRCKCWLTAQSRQDARDTWLDVAELVTHSPLSPIIADRKSNGSEALTSPLGSTFRVFAPTEDGLHGKANELVTVDEVWAFDGLEGVALEQAILPTFTTTGGQMWLTSTAGTAKSQWFLDYVKMGRAAVKAGSTERIAYFEWSVDELAAAEIELLLTEVRKACGVAALEDPAFLAKLDRALDLTLAAHPGEYARRDAVADAAVKMPPLEFLRAYGNHWTTTADGAIPASAWAGCRDVKLLSGTLAGMFHGTALPKPDQLDGLAFDVDAEDRVAIAGAWRFLTLDAVDVLDVVPRSQAVERIEQLAATYGVQHAGYDKAGPGLDIADELARRGKVEPAGIAGHDHRAACAGILATINAGALIHRATPALDEAVANAATRDVGDGGFLWSRRHSAGSIAGLTAGTIARWQLHHAPAPAAAPVIATRRR